MVTNEHFQRLKNIYTSLSSSPGFETVALSYGRAELEGTIDTVQKGAVLNRMPHQQFLSDAASLAAGTLQKEHLVGAEQFTVDIIDPDYEGPVLVAAEVVLVESSRYVVEAMIEGEAGEVIAEATGIFRPSDEALPPDPSPGSENDPASSPPPASLIPVFTTPYGMMCLN